MPTAKFKTTKHFVAVTKNMLAILAPPLDARKLNARKMTTAEETKFVKRQGTDAWMLALSSTAAAEHAPPPTTFQNAAVNLDLSSPKTSALTLTNAKIVPANLLPSALILSAHTTVSAHLALSQMLLASVNHPINASPRMTVPPLLTVLIISAKILAKPRAPVAVMLFVLQPTIVQCALARPEPKAIPTSVALPWNVSATANVARKGLVCRTNVSMFAACLMFADKTPTAEPQITSLDVSADQVSREIHPLAAPSFSFVRPKSSVPPPCCVILGSVHPHASHPGSVWRIKFVPEVLASPSARIPRNAPCFTPAMMASANKSLAAELIKTVLYPKTALVEKLVCLSAKTRVLDR
jgi:hypothetical protein